MTTTHGVYKDVIDFVRLGFRNSVSLHFLVHLPNQATFDEAMRAAGSSNEFDPDSIIDTIAPIYSGAMHVEFGREASPVLYISVPFHHHQRYGHPHESTARYGRLSDDERIAYARQVTAWAQKMRADEISVQQHPVPTDGKKIVLDGRRNVGPHPYRVRIWWD